jgi:hypothetical protein
LRVTSRGLGDVYKRQVQPPVYYNNPPLMNYGPAAVLGAAIGGYIDQQH